MLPQTCSGGLAPLQAHRQSHVVRSMAGGRGRFSDSSLILGPSGRPQQPSNAPGSGGLILPGQYNQGGQGRSQRSPIGQDDSAAGPLPNKYRPPPGFMNDNVQDPALAQANPQQLLSKLRAQSGYWHDLAKCLPILYAKGFDTSTIAEMTGVNPADQNRWVVAGTVYDSLVATGKVEPNILEQFDNGGDHLLYHFRFLPAERRAAAAKYIVANDLEEPVCEVLARAMKEWDRRPGERTGFTDSPGDCMAFKYLRDAAECRSAEAAAEKLTLAFQAAETDGAVARLTDWQQSELDAAAATTSFASKAMLNVLRLQQDELGFRPLPQVAVLQELSTSELLDAPTTHQEGAFGAFNMPATDRDQKWVALPQWNALSLATHPVAIPLVDCAAEPSVLAASGAKTEEEKKRLTGAGLLVVDTVVSKSVQPTSFYVVKQPSDGRLVIAEGARLSKDEAPVAEVLFLCRPPNRESAITSAELLQL